MAYTEICIHVKNIATLSISSLHMDLYVYVLTCVCVYTYDCMYVILINRMYLNMLDTQIFVEWRVFVA